MWHVGRSGDWFCAACRAGGRAADKEAPVAVAEGLRLHLCSNSTGYKGVYEQSGRFQAKHRVGGRLVDIGYFGTAVEAAVAYARAVGEAPAEASAEGLRLHLSSSSSTGYKCVYLQDGRFIARQYKPEQMESYLGSFDTAVEAAVAYARAVHEVPACQGEAPPLPAKRALESATAPPPPKRRSSSGSAAASSSSSASSSSASSSSAAASSAAAASSSSAAASSAPPAPSAPRLPESRLFELLPDGRTVHKEAPPPTGGIAAVAEALERVGLENYVAAFDAEGFDDIEFLGGLDAAERAGVARDVGMKQGHLSKFVKHGFEARS